MRPAQRRARIVIATLTFLSAAVARPIEAQEAGDQEPMGRSVRDPGRESRERGALAPGAHLPEYSWIITPNFRYSDNARTGWAQLRFASDTLIPDMSFHVSASVGTTRAPSGVARGRYHLTAEVDPIVDKPWAGLKWTLALSAEYLRTVGVQTAQEYAVQLDSRVLSSGAPANLTLGVIGYFDRAVPRSKPITSGATLGVTATWKISRSTKLVPEYDFSSSFNGEYLYSVQLRHTFETLSNRPTLLISAAKHDVYSLGMRFTFDKPYKT